LKKGRPKYANKGDLKSVSFTVCIDKRTNDKLTKLAQANRHKRAEEVRYIVEEAVNGSNRPTDL